MVSDEKLMAYLLKTGSEGRGKSEIPLFPLPFNPEGLELQEKDIRGVTVAADVEPGGPDRLGHFPGNTDAVVAGCVA